MVIYNIALHDCSTDSSCIVKYICIASIFAVMFKAAVNTQVQVLCGLNLSACMSKHLGLWLLDYMMYLGLALYESPELSSKMIIPFFIPINNGWEVFVLRIPTNI